MSAFAEYKDTFTHAKLQRDDSGILLIRFHDDDGEFHWSFSAAGEIHQIFAAVGSDPDNRVIIMTGTGTHFLRFDLTRFGSEPEGKVNLTPLTADFSMRRQIANIRTQLDIEVPVIAAINGPVQTHAEIPLMSDICLAADTAYFADESHIIHGGVPGDGAHVFWPAVLGANRARYLLWMNEKIHAEEALRVGLVGEVLPPDDVLSRAYIIARRLVDVPELTRRYTRLLLTQNLRQAMLTELPMSMALTQLSSLGRPRSADSAGSR